jgi:fructose-1,6-bisphosphatase/inositol monophosphatase family enzyme
VAAGRVDAFVDPGSHLGAWDYLGALLVCTESGVAVGERSGRELLVLDPAARRGPIVAATGELRDALDRALAALGLP